MGASVGPGLGGGALGLDFGHPLGDDHWVGAGFQGTPVRAELDVAGRDLAPRLFGGSVGDGTILGLLQVPDRARQCVRVLADRPVRPAAPVVHPMIGAAGSFARIAHEPDAFASFYREHVTAVTRFVARRVADPHTVADLTAEVFLAVIGSAHTYRPGRGTQVAWLYGIARNPKTHRDRPDGSHAERYVSDLPVIP